MNSITKKIQLDLYSDKADEFYLSLLKYKLSEKADLEILKKLADAICFDKESVIDSLELSDAQQKEIHNRLLSIHTFLLGSKKYSSDYFTVSKENFEKFEASEFGKALYDIFFIMEITARWKGKEESAEVKGVAAMWTWMLAGLMQGISDSTGKFLSGALNVAIAFNDPLPLNIKLNKKGNLVAKSDGDTIELEIFAEKNGQIKRIPATDLENYSEENVVYMKHEDITMRIRHTGDNIELTRYDKVKNQKLDLSKATAVETISLPKEQYGGVTINDDGSVNYPPKGNPPVSEITGETSKPIIYNHEELLKEQNKDKKEQNKHKDGKQKQNHKSDIQSSASIFAMLDENITSFLKLPKNNPEKVQARDKIIVSIYELLKTHYPQLSTQHSYTTITGYIASRMQLLDSEELHDESKRKQPYRKYLRDMAYNILAGNSII